MSAPSSRYVQLKASNMTISSAAIRTTRVLQFQDEDSDDGDDSLHIKLPLCATRAEYAKIFERAAKKFRNP